MSAGVTDLFEIMKKLRLQLQGKGVHGLQYLMDCFHKFDEDQTGTLDREEFDSLVSYCGLFLAGPETQKIIRRFDMNGHERISFDDFYKELRGSLSERRHALIDNVFRALDRDNRGSIEKEDIFAVLHANISAHPEVESGIKSADQVLKEFTLALSETGSHGPISHEEFAYYFHNISVCTSHDDNYFARICERVWGVRETPLEASLASTSSSLSTALSGTGKWVERMERKIRDKVRLKVRGPETLDAPILRAFKFFDLMGSGRANIDMFNKVMDRLGTQFSEEELRNLFAYYDVEGTGELEYKQFAADIVSRDNVNDNLSLTKTLI
eukprot:GILI01006788.1.p1 GENE.GILI01006788.1~~GILI01006788.1.p1  ORF type:complete len:326 (-),score=66.45 GILI01006788.1:108-1085(-)